MMTDKAETKQKLNLGSIAKDIQKRFEKKNPRMAKKISTGSELKTSTAEDFLIMPSWFQEATKTLGLGWGRIHMWAGDSDSGKTSLCIAAMKVAQDQGVPVIYVETENKTSKSDLVGWGVDPDGIILIKSTVAEEAFDLMFEAWDSVKDAYPDKNLLVIYDSIGNNVSMRDSELKLTEQNQKPGGKGTINRLAISKLIAKMNQDKAAVLFTNYTYDNIGSPGKTNAGGKAVNFYSSLTYQTSRKSWIEATVKGKRVRKGALVVWKLFKNHIDRTNPGPKAVELSITAEGIQVSGSDGENSE
jgi:RecA/RadA recombinase